MLSIDHAYYVLLYGASCREDSSSSPYLRKTKYEAAEFNELRMYPTTTVVPSIAHGGSQGDPRAHQDHFFCGLESHRVHGLPGILLAVPGRTFSCRKKEYY